MRASLTSEAEHRRGLVLGFTIAEALLLLLFLLLLALGAQLVKLRGQLDATPEEDKAERFRLEEQLAQVRPVWEEAERINPKDPSTVLVRGLGFLESLARIPNPAKQSS